MKSPQDETYAWYGPFPGGLKFTQILKDLDLAAGHRYQRGLMALWRDSCAAVLPDGNLYFRQKRLKKERVADHAYICAQAHQTDLVDGTGHMDPA